MLKPATITPQRVNVWYKPIKDPSFAKAGDLVFVGHLNEYEFNDLRVQIAESGEEGYFVEFEYGYFEINKYGALNYWPDGLFDLLQDQAELILSTATYKKKCCAGAGPPARVTP